MGDQDFGVRHRSPDEWLQIAELELGQHYQPLHQKTTAQPWHWSDNAQKPSRR